MSKWPITLKKCGDGSYAVYVRIGYVWNSEGGKRGFWRRSGFNPKHVLAFITRTDAIDSLVEDEKIGERK